MKSPATAIKPNQIASAMTVLEFCSAHNACDDGRTWALENCRDMQHAWETLNPEWLVWVATRKGVLSNKELRLFAVWSARQVQHLMSDQRSIDALDVAERFAHGNATPEELATARNTAWGAARGAAWGAASDAAKGAAKDAAWAAASDAARALASDAARAAASDTAWAAAWAAARAAQAEWLRKNTTPNFGRHCG